MQKERVSALTFRGAHLFNLWHLFWFESVRVSGQRAVLSSIFLTPNSPGQLYRYFLLIEPDYVSLLTSFIANLSQLFYESGIYFYFFQFQH